MRTIKLGIAAVGLAALWSLHGVAQGPGGRANAPAEPWPTYQHNSDFSPLTQITPAIVGRLTHAWTFNFGGGTRESFIGASRDRTFRAFDAKTGKELWVIDLPANGNAASYYRTTHVGPERLDSRLSRI